MRAWIAAAAAALAIVVCASPAFADDRGEKEARALFKEGNKALDAGNYVDALDLFRGAYARWPNPKILLNMGTALRALGRYAEAADTYEKYLADSSADPKKKPEVQAILTDLSGKVGKIHVEVNEPGARVLVDGREVGQSPQTITLRVDPGTHAVVAEKEGYALAAATVSVSAGEERVVQLRLIPPTNRPDTTKPDTTKPDITKPDTTKPDTTKPDTTIDVADTGDDGSDTGDDGEDDGSGGATVIRKTPASSTGGLGIIGRWDTDPMHSGSVVALGVTYGFGSLEAGVAALVSNPTVGGWVGARYFIMTGSFRPTVTVGFPIISNEGVHFGIHAAAGAQYNINPNLGLYLDLGVIMFPDAERNGTFFAPSIGLQYRL